MQSSPDWAKHITVWHSMAIAIMTAQNDLKEDQNKIFCSADVENDMNDVDGWCICEFYEVTGYLLQWIKIKQRNFWKIEKKPLLLYNFRMLIRSAHSCWYQIFDWMYCIKLNSHDLRIAQIIHAKNDGPIWRPNQNCKFRNEVTPSKSEQWTHTRQICLPKMYRMKMRVARWLVPLQCAIHHMKCVANARTYGNKTKLMAVVRRQGRTGTMQTPNDKNLFAKITSMLYSLFSMNYI